MPCKCVKKKDSFLSRNQKRLYLRKYKIAPHYVTENTFVKIIADIIVCVQNI